ncbi:hypothetical protein LINPERPRIM_LOCUS27796 [Linum perenne]
MSIHLFLLLLPILFSCSATLALYSPFFLTFSVIPNYSLHSKKTPINIHSEKTNQLESSYLNNTQASINATECYNKETSTSHQKSSHSSCSYFTLTRDDDGSLLCKVLPWRDLSRVGNDIRFSHPRVPWIPPLLGILNRIP